MCTVHCVWASAPFTNVFNRNDLFLFVFVTWLLVEYSGEIVCGCCFAISTKWNDVRWINGICDELMSAWINWENCVMRAFLFSFYWFIIIWNHRFMRFHPTRFSFSFLFLFLKYIADRSCLPHANNWTWNW